MFKRFLTFNINDKIPFLLPRGHITKTYNPNYDYDELPDKLITYCKLTKTHHYGTYDLSDHVLLKTKYNNIDDISKRFYANINMNFSSNPDENLYKNIYRGLFEFLINEVITQQKQVDTLSNENILLDFYSEIEGHWCNDLNMFTNNFKSPLIIRGHKTLEPFTKNKLIYPFDCKEYHNVKNIIYHLQYLKKKIIKNRCLEDYAGFSVIPDRRERVWKKPQVIGKIPKSCFPRFIVIKAKTQNNFHGFNNYYDSLIAANIICGFTALSTLIGKLNRQIHNFDGWGHNHGLELKEPFSTFIIGINPHGCILTQYQMNTLSTLNNEVGLMNQAWSSEYFKFDSPLSITECIKHLLTALYKVYYYD